MANSYVFTPREARVIRRLRVKGACTWRMVAAKAAELWPDRDIASGNQIDGMTLCREAAELLGEYPGEPPWN